MQQSFLIIRQQPRLASQFRLSSVQQSARVARRKFSTSSKSSSNSDKAKQETQQGEENIINRFVEWYTNKLSSHPMLTKSITGGLIAGSGDFFCQTAIEESEESAWDEWDPARTLRFWFLGTFFVSPGNHFWYKLLAKRLAPGTTMPQVTKRVVYDQFVYTPVWTFLWLASLWTLEGSTPKEIQDTMQRGEYRRVIVANWLLWIPAQFANFRMIPLKFQVLFVNGVELVWNAFLSFTASGKGEDKEEGNARKNRREREKREKEKQFRELQLSDRTRTSTPSAAQV